MNTRYESSYLVILQRALEKGRSSLSLHCYTHLFLEICNQGIEHVGSTHYIIQERTAKLKNAAYLRSVVWKYATHFMNVNR